MNNKHLDNLVLEYKDHLALASGNNPTNKAKEMTYGYLSSVQFSDEEGNIYDVYTELSRIKLHTSLTTLKDKTLKIGRRTFSINAHQSCFHKENDGYYLDLKALLGFKDHLKSQVLVLELIDEDNEIETTYAVYLSRYILIKDPRKKENNNHLSLILDSLTLDFLYKREDNTSNLSVNIDSKKLSLLLK